MVSLVIFAIVMILVMVIVAIKTGEVTYATYVGMLLGCFGIMTVLIIGVLAPGDIVEQEEYPVYSAGNNLYFVDDKNEMREVTSEYRCVSDSNIHSPVVRITSYDTSYILKKQEKCLVLPEIKS